jgi:PAS domain S-box-containing protein
METRRHPTRVLLVETDQHDDRLIRDSLSKIPGEKYKLDRVMDRDAARDALVRGSYDLCLFSLGSEARNDHGLVNEMLQTSPNIPIILLLYCSEKISGDESICTKVADTLTADEISAGLLERSMRYAIDRMASKAALDKSCARMQAILDNMPVGVILLEGEPPRPVMINRKGEQLLGRSLTASTTSSGLAPCFQAYRAGTGEPYPIEGKLVARAMAGEPVFADDMEIRRPDGSSVLLEVLGAPVRDTSGRISGAVAIYQDITERKRMEEALQESEHRFRRAMDATSDGIWEWNVDTGSVYYSPAYFRMLGYQPGDFPSTYDSWLQLIHPDDCQRAFESNEACIRNDSPNINVEFRMRARDGSWRWILGRGVATRRNADGRALQMIGTHVDITERKEAEEKLRESEERFREIAENIREVFWVRTPETMLYISPAYEEIWGLSRESLYKDPASFIKFVHPEDRERVLKAYDAERQGVASFHEEYRLLRPDGETRWILARSFPIREEGRVVRTAGIAEDITARKEAEEFLRIERDLAIELGSVASLNNALELLLDACLKMDYLDCGGIYLVEPEDAVLRLVCYRGLSADFVRQVSLFDLTSPQGCFVMQGEPGYWGNPVDLLEMKGLLQDEGITALAAIPVKSDGRVLALLNVSSHTRLEIPIAVRAALEGIAAHIGEIISRVRLGETIKAQSERLEETNAALRVLLRQREQDRAEMEESLLSNVRHLIMPCLDKLKGGRLADDQRQLMEILESHLREITAPFVRRIAAPMLGLTPREIRVAELIRQGMSSQEIADLLVISRSAVIFHRQGIRRKLSLIGKRVNLQAYLAALPL